MIRPRVDALSLWPPLALAALGAAAMYAGHLLAAFGRLVELVDTAHDDEGDED